MTSALVEFEDVTRTHSSGGTQVHALQGVDLRVDYGELVAVMGPSGSGKTNLLNLAGALDTPTSGRVVVAGVDLSTASPDERARLRRRSIGLVFQDYNLVSSLTVRENVALPLELDDVAPRQASAQATALLARLGLADRGSEFPDRLSGGQRQRVAIARSVIGTRSLILADEPTGALDSVLGEEVIELLRAQIGPECGGILVTHDPRYAAWADRTVFLKDGRIVAGTAPLVKVESLTGPISDQASGAAS
ncbi:ABC transporter ATP-binding protein [Microbacterium nymphoidis]|uniref:ABC transporter ATP-binding protein n=1 Tax=Microbacterium nymphoidis TaxID=2898586 RepID=UPI001E36A415|nr:ABC transporter ATP-binding protein [Microbacterium nymphoidis]MCD2498460.1 ABC transporter ATP-binding protein [Microbacterium nymphoidis]